MVSTDHKLRLRRAQMLSQGGDAADAAVAAALMLGSWVPLVRASVGVVSLSSTERTADFPRFSRGRPRKATRDMFLDDAGKPIPNASRRGRKPRCAERVSRSNRLLDVMENSPGRRWWVGSTAANLAFPAVAYSMKKSPNIVMKSLEAKLQLCF